MSVFSFSGVYGLPTHCASAAFTSKTFEVFKEQHDIAPIIINERMRYVPWGGDNIMPYNIINFLTGMGTAARCLLNVLCVTQCDARIFTNLHKLF